MSTELKSIKGRKETEFGYNESEIKLTRFSGGKNGRMVQININPDVDRNGIFTAHIQLTQEQVRELITELDNEISEGGESSDFNLHFYLVYKEKSIIFDLVIT